MTIGEAIQAAEKILPGIPSAEGKEDPRWQAILAVGEHIETNPEEVWGFVKRWGCDGNDDLRSAVATCLLEHLLEYHFDTLFSRVEKLATSNPMFADTVSMCAKFGQTKEGANADSLNRLLRSVGQAPPDTKAL